MATYSTNLSTVTLCQDATGFSELASPHSSGSTPASSTENYIQNGNAVDQATGQGDNQDSGMEFIGSSLTWTTSSNWVFMGWVIYASPTNLKTWSTGGFRIGISSSADNTALYNAMGNDFANYPYGGWQSIAIDPEFAGGADQNIGTPTTPYVGLAFLPNVTVKITKGSPIAVDAWRYGRGDIIVTGTGATFTGMASANDASTAKWGLFKYAGGTYEWKGLMTLGESGTAVTFSDSNKVIKIDDTPRVTAGFNAIEISNASSSVTWENITIIGVPTSITGSAPISAGSFEMIDDATVAFTSCVFSDMETFIFDSNATIDTCTFKGCGQVTQGGGTFDTCNFDDSSAAVSLVADSLADLTDCTFSSDGSNHAVNLGTISATASMNWNNYLTGYASSNGSTGNEAILVNVASGQTLTINVGAGYDTPYYHNTGTGTVSVVSGQVTLTVKVLHSDGSTLTTEDANVLVEAATGGDLSVGTDIIKGFTDTSGLITDTRSYTADQPMTGWVRKGTSAPFYKQSNVTATMDKGADLTLTIQLVDDE